MEYGEMEILAVLVILANELFFIFQHFLGLMMTNLSLNSKVIRGERVSHQNQYM